MSFHDTGKAFSFRNTENINLLTLFERFNTYGTAKFQFLIKLCKIKLSQLKTRGYSSLLVMALQRLADILFLSYANTNLISIVTICIYTFNLCYKAWSCLNNCAGYRLAFLIE